MHWLLRIIEPLTSRCSKFRFKPLANGIQEERILEICKKENLKYTQQVNDQQLLHRASKAVTRYSPLLHHDWLFTCDDVLLLTSQWQFMKMWISLPPPPPPPGNWWAGEGVGGRSEESHHIFTECSQAQCRRRDHREYHIRDRWGECSQLVKGISIWLHTFKAISDLYFCYWEGFTIKSVIWCDF